MTAAAPTAPRPAATSDAALRIQRRSGTLLVGVEGGPGSRAAVRWAARHARRLIVAPLPDGLRERDAENSAACDLIALADHEPALDACAWLQTIADGSSPAEGFLECARMHACEAIVIGPRDDGYDVANALVRMAGLPVIVVPPHAHTREDRS